MYCPTTYCLLKAVISAVFMWIHIIKSDLAEKNIYWLGIFFGVLLVAGNFENNRDCGDFLSKSSKGSCLDFGKVEQQMMTFNVLIPKQGACVFYFSYKTLALVFIHLLMHNYIAVLSLFLLK